uniref:Putative secreted protein n=1 Tax=Anopheles darlingi TaxID=43151 RepID=A0A2M4DBH9_ANODA
MLFLSLSLSLLRYASLLLVAYVMKMLQNKSVASFGWLGSLSNNERKPRKVQKRILSGMVAGFCCTFSRGGTLLHTCHGGC